MSDLSFLSEHPSDEYASDSDERNSDTGCSENKVRCNINNKANVSNNESSSVSIQ